MALRSRAKSDLLIAISFVVGMTLLGAILDLDFSERLFHWSQKAELWELDELIIALLWFVLASVAYAWRRVKDIQQLNAELASHAYIDGITQLPNRALALEKLERKIARADRLDKQIAVMFIDFDNFKMVNDTYGHHQGDALIRSVGDRINSVVRRGDTVGRLGGDEFVVLLQIDKDSAQLVPILTRIMATQHAPHSINQHEIFVNLSVGIAIYPRDGKSPDDLLKAADTAMYRSKENGKGQYHFYTPDMGAALTERYHFELAIKNARTNREFSLVYQPQYDAKSTSVTGYEALIRWQKDGKYISPAEFISVAEESGQINAIGEWVLSTALKESESFLKPGQLLSVNISPRQFGHAQFAAQIEALLAGSQIPSSQLELEITESALANEKYQPCSVLKQLRKQGIKVAIDDFGTGYSSLNRLRELPITRLKIDRVFIDRLMQSEIDKNLVVAILDLARYLSLEVVAEGVENQEQLSMLQTLGCQHIQGYFLSRPISAADLTKVDR